MSECFTMFPSPIHRSLWMTWSSCVWLGWRSSPLRSSTVSISLKRSLNDLVKQMSSGCTMLVKSSGMTAWIEQFFFRSCFEESPRWVPNEFETRRLLELSCTTGSWMPHLLNPQFHPIFIHPTLGYTWTRTPGQNLTLGMVFQRKITNGFSLVPSTRQESTTVNIVFLCPVVSRSHVLTPRVSAVLAAGMSNHMGFIHVSDLYQFVVSPFSPHFILLLCQPVLPLGFFRAG